MSDQDNLTHMSAPVYKCRMREKYFGQGVVL